jgi:hypothetical protein
VSWFCLVDGLSAKNGTAVAFGSPIEWCSSASLQCSKLENSAVRSNSLRCFHPWFTRAYLLLVVDKSCIFHFVTDWLVKEKLGPHLCKMSML